MPTAVWCWHNLVCTSCALIDFTEDMANHLRACACWSFAAVNDASARTAAAETDAQELQFTLTQIAKAATMQPGMSWRVGVSAPDDGSAQAAGELAAVMTRKLRPAIMRVSAV
jgi:hypothetical protein